MGSKSYVKNAVKVVEALIAEDDPEARLKSTARSPFPSGYKPELDVTPELNDELGSRFLQLIGVPDGQLNLGDSTTLLRYHNYRSTKRYRGEGILKRYITSLLI